MSYDELITRLAIRSGVHSELVRKVLVHLPDTLLDLGIGDKVYTPLGVFRKIVRKARPIVLPDGKTEALVGRKVLVRLKPGTRLEEN